MNDVFIFILINVRFVDFIVKVDGREFFCRTSGNTNIEVYWPDDTQHINSDRFMSYWYSLFILA